MCSRVGGEGMSGGGQRESERDASACMKRHQAFALAPVSGGGKGRAGEGCANGANVY